ncbi:MAG: hypothetical protein LQ337_006670 [Flavoplaca oasis]|nr:MAG: hypothetical protein LQ337_006670 [Flavoplaca oasis]
MVYLGKRDIYGDDDYDYDYDGYHGGWWHSETAEVIRWVIVAALLFGLFLLVAGGYVHARRRVRRGQTPLRYHRWLLPRSQRRFQPAQPFPYQQNPYEMYPYPAPPPAYHNNGGPPPPRYEPPQGASKMNPSQQTFAPGPPQAVEASNAGPAPAAAHHQQTSAERFEAVPLQSNGPQPPPRPQPSSRSWNPLKRFR